MMLRGKALVLLTVVVMAAACPAIAQPGSLGALRETVRTEPGPSSSNNDETCDSSARRGSGSSDCCDDDDDDSLWGTFWFHVFTSPWGLPHALAGDDFDRMAFFSDAPYDGGPGYLLIEPVVPEQFHCWGGHFRAEYADDFDPHFPFDFPHFGM